jgi:hypothetical protein
MERDCRLEMTDITKTLLQEQGKEVCNVFSLTHTLIKLLPKCEAKAKTESPSIRNAITMASSLGQLGLAARSLS